jgi:predicted ester cyclase
MAFPAAHWHVEEMVAEGDKVTTRWTARGTHQAELPGNPPLLATGKSVIVPGIWLHWITSGQIVESWNLWDTLGMLQQLGVILTPGQGGS